MKIAACRIGKARISCYIAVTRKRFLEAGEPADQVTTLAALRRFRPIFLTALTTFLGLGPMIIEKSIQALFLVPMAISVGVGTLVSSLVILFLIPAAFTLMEDFQRARARARSGTAARHDRHEEEVLAK